MKNLILLLSLLLSVGQSMAQNSLRGIITDKNDDDAGVPIANVILKKNGEMVAGTATDFDGYYNLSNLSAATYDLEISTINMPTIIINGLQIFADTCQIYNASYPKNDKIDTLEVIYIEADRPIIKNTYNGRVLTAEEIERLERVDISTPMVSYSFRKKLRKQLHKQHKKEIRQQQRRAKAAKKADEKAKKADKKAQIFRKY